METMKHKGALTISRPSYGDGSRKISIQVKDVDAVTRFLEIEIYYDKFAECVTGLSEVECELQFNGIENVGKVRESKNIEFKIGKVGYSDRIDIATNLAHKNCPDGWRPYCYFRSQNSFFTRDGEEWAITTILRWVEK